MLAVALDAVEVSFDKLTGALFELLRNPEVDPQHAASGSRPGTEYANVVTLEKGGNALLLQDILHLFGVQSSRQRPDLYPFAVT